MRRLDFLEALSEKLNALPQVEINRSVAYYDEMIEDRMEDGMAEEEAVAALGDLNEIAQDILKGLRVSPTPSRTPVSAPKSRGGLRLTLILLGLPIWLPLMLACFLVVFSLYLAAWAVLICLYAAAVTLIACGPLAVVAIAFQGRTFVDTLWVVGMGLSGVGIGMLLFPALNRCVKPLISVSGRVFSSVFQWFNLKKWGI